MNIINLMVVFFIYGGPLLHFVISLLSMIIRIIWDILFKSTYFDYVRFCHSDSIHVGNNQMSLFP